jgi:hypothetical protein
MFLRGPGLPSAPCSGLTTCAHRPAPERQLKQNLPDTHTGRVYHAGVRLVPEMDTSDRSLAITYGQPELAHTCVLDEMTSNNLVSRSSVRCVHNLMGLQVDAPKHDLDDYGSL